MLSELKNVPLGMTFSSEGGNGIGRLDRCVWSALNGGSVEGYIDDNGMTNRSCD